MAKWGTIGAETIRGTSAKPGLGAGDDYGLHGRYEKAYRYVPSPPEIIDYAHEPLLAIIPGATLAEFWQSISAFEQVLLVISGFVLAAGLLGMLTTLLSTLNERRREMAVLRAIGAHPHHVLLLFVLETLFVVLAGCLAGLGLLYSMLYMARPLLVALYGINIEITMPDQQKWGLFAVAIGAGVLVSLIPGWIAYRRSLQDGLALKI